MQRQADKQTKAAKIKVSQEAGPSSLVPLRHLLSPGDRWRANQAAWCLRHSRAAPPVSSPLNLDGGTHDRWHLCQCDTPTTPLPLPRTMNYVDVTLARGGCRKNMTPVQPDFSSLPAELGGKRHCILCQRGKKQDQNTTEVSPNGFRCDRLNWNSLSLWCSNAATLTINWQFIICNQLDLLKN